ncbi:AGE family epimerase/isomerase [Marinifilum caeruleilacunae]|uniref:Cellobiose 2-epimerase n=1 Tax=Marinifilum caeruleilacunae TaxID=2499076 RepID=A0ABX1WUA9_9BACT|nr:AGE family epimerase/isomerase [Marinifilum caeruleilacunae]NOU59696.1 N-acyl-D-glucosamine 2-epimerase [Marinifilum caeruleilacunae]
MKIHHNKTTKVQLEPGLDDLCAEMSEELRRLLHFWSTEAVDTEFGGYISRIDHYGNKDVKANKGAVLNSRILWTFSAAYRLTGEQKYLESANRAYFYLINHFWDKEFGGLIWSIDYKGNALNTRKQAYAQGFGIYALSEYYRITENEECLDYAKSLYFILEEKFQDKEYMGYIEALTQNWSKQEDMRLSDKDANSPKSMNTHLHILEPYTNLYRVWKDDRLQNSMLSLLDLFVNKITDSNTGHFNLFFDMDWSVHSSSISYGHDIEGAWLMNEAAEEIGDSNLMASIQKVTKRLVDITINEGMDKDASLFNEREDEKLDTDKHWWPQAEAMVGLVDAWEWNDKAEYLGKMSQVWTFIKAHLVDKVNGEWYWRVNQNGEPIESEDKVGFWKCSYHNCRALMEVITRLRYS